MLRAKKMWWVSIPVIFLAAALMLTCPSCQPLAPERPFRTVELLVDLSVMPPGWKLDARRELGKGTHHLSVGDSAVVVFTAEGESPHKPTQQYVHRYRNSSAAKGVYEQFVHPAGTTPSDWTYQSPVADQTIFACYDYEGREPYPICEWSGRYEEYVVTVYSWLITGRMSLQDLEQMIRAVDARIARHLDKSSTEENSPAPSP